jgi:large subunit ribosomal protein L18
MAVWISAGVWRLTSDIWHLIMAKRSRQDVRRAIHSRIRKKVRGDESRPRLAIFRSVNHIYAQLINDDDGVTICSAGAKAETLTPPRWSAA